MFATFIYGGVITNQQIGLGFAAAIFVDAYIRTVLVSAVMHLLGRAGSPPWPAGAGSRGL